MQTNTKFLLVFFLLSILTIAPDLVAQNHSYDQYGGRLDIQLDKGTGFFCLGEVEGKHFLITPEGNAYKALGLNHMHTTSRKDYDKIIDELKALGFNSGDYQGPNWQWNRIPYTKGVNLTKTSIWLSEDKFEFEDVFAESFLIEMEENIKNTVSPQANNKMLIAYFLTDVPRWNGSQYGSSWLEFFKSLDNSTSGKIVWNQWKSNNPDTPEDDFLALIARQIYSKGIGFIRKYDPNHMVFTERYWETNIPEQVVAEALPFVDGIATQPSNHVKKEFYDYLTNKYKLPIYVADHVTSYATAEYPITMGQVASNPTDYLEFYTSAVQTALSHPFVIGYNKCQYQDEAKPTQLKQGLYRADASPYPYLENLDEVHQNALELGHYLPTDKYTDQLLDWGEYENTKREAYDRIDQYRKGDEHLKVILPGDEIATNSEIRIKLKQHDFKWGAVVKESFVTSPHKEKYKEIFPKYFNATGFGVACKPKFRGTSREQNLLNNAMPFFLNNDVYVRGHTLTWEGINFIRPEDKAIYENNSLSDEVKADSMLASMGKHFPHAIPQWDVEAWDVSNEPIANNLVNDLLPDYNTHVHWFKLADSIRNTCGKGDVLLFQNDYQIISAISSWAMGRPAKYREILDEQIALGAPIEGIGFQSRLKHGLITPDTIYKRLCDFDKYNLPYHATEFEIRDDANKYVYTDDERRLLTEYMMVMYFSHPKVKLFTHWTFADARSTENLDYPLFNYDGTPKVNGKIWIDLMEGFFNTDEMFSSDGNGELDVHGYYGSYDLIFESGNDFFLGSFRIDSSTAESVLEVHLDKGFNLTGLEDSLIYALDEDINIEI